ncbi:MAG: Verru_Chthon cassette protein A, partial [Chthoniobacterales bacterium]
MIPRLMTHSRHNSSGIALVMVLCILVLISGLVLAFFSTVYTESELGANRTAQAEADRLADSALQIVMGQIREATTQDGRTWASQPGAIFNYDAAGSRRLFKLFSAENMIVANPAGDPFADDLPSPGSAFTLPGRSYSARWADLNTPIVTSDGGSAVPVFPIVNPLASQLIGGDLPVEGFSIDSSRVDGIVDSAADPESARLPMPVKWLYLTATNVAAPGPGGSETSVSVPGATGPASQVIGRVAFWTDDDTNKINVNTAGGDRWNGYADTSDLAGDGFGTFWDVPIGYSKLETDLARYQPWNREFQRYPGHPATVFLSAIFPNLTAEQIANIVPRITYGDQTSASGSKSGTKGLGDESSGSVAGLNRVELDEDRLYASLEEVIYNEDRSEQAPDLVTAERLNRVGFFATARSSAPEITLFGTPRIAIWPIHLEDDDVHRSAFDNLIAFCSTIPNGPSPLDQREYYFQRANADSPTNDYDRINRNQELYGYLRRLTSAAVPGFGPSLVSTSYTSEQRDQILTQIFDYIRSTNLWDPLIGMREFTSGGGSGVTFTDGYNSDPTIRDDSGDNPVPRTNPGLGQVTPIRIADTAGFGRFPTISEAGFVFIANGESPRNSEAEEHEKLDTKPE